MPTLEDVARLAGVSRNSVSLVVQGKDNKKVSPENRRRILEAIEQTGYRPNLFARGLTKGSSQILALVVATEAESFMRLHFSMMLEGIELACREHGYSLIVAVSRRNKDGTLDFTQFDTGFVDGFITAETDIYYRPVGRRTEHGRPVIMVRNVVTENMDCIGIDNQHWAAESVRHLISLGHRRIGFAAEFDHPEGVQRVEGYQRAMREAGLAWDRRYVARAHFFSREDCELAAAKLLDNNRPPTAIVTGNDFIASVMIYELQKRGMLVPDDVAVVGFDNDLLATTTRPTLTTVQQPFSEMGYLAAVRLIERIRNPRLPVERLLIPAKLIVRESCGAKHKPIRPSDPPGAERKLEARRRALKEMRTARP